MAIDCDTARHHFYQGLSWLMIVFFGFGTPLLFWLLLWPHRRNLNHADASNVAFFHQDYTADHWYWEVVECFRKLLFTGLALFFSDQGSLLQTAMAMTLLVLYIPLLVKLQPYKLPGDNAVAVLANVALFFVLFSSLLLKVKTSFASTGRFEEGFTEDSLGYGLIAVAVSVIVAWLVSLLHDIREFNVCQSFRHKDSGELLVLPKLDSTEDETFHIFISHSQQDGGDQTAHVKKELEKYVPTAVIFTDVAAGRVERQLTEKTELAGAIRGSAVFLVFLTKTYFTRKWCILELQQAIALRKHIAVIWDTDERHGGMASLEALVEYAQGQKARCAADAKQKESNLFNQDVVGSTMCADLGEWVASHVSVTGGKLTIGAFDFKGAHVEATAWTAVAWYRFADWKLVALQLAMEDMLRMKSRKPWLREGREAGLRLPVVRARLGRARSGQFHIAVSDAHPPSKAVAAKLAAFSGKIRVLRVARGRVADTKTACPCVLVVLGQGLVSDRAYQQDVCSALGAGLRVVLVQDCTEALGDISDALWDRLAKKQSRDLFPFTEKHIRAIFNPISIRCMPALLQAEHEQQNLFDESTLVQLERTVAAAQPLGAGPWLACAEAAERAVRGCTRAGVRDGHRCSGGRVPSRVTTLKFENPMHTANPVTTQAAATGAGLAGKEATTGKPNSVVPGSKASVVSQTSSKSGSTEDGGDADVTADI